MRYCTEDEASTFDRYFHCRSYLNQRSRWFDENREVPPPGPVTLREDWNLLRRNVPLAYLKAIGADHRVLAYTLELDAERYEASLRALERPRYAVLRPQGPEYIDHLFATNVPEQEAVGELLELAERSQTRCLIAYGNMRKIVISPEAEIHTLSYRPRLAFTRKLLLVFAEGDRRRASAPEFFSV